MLKKTYLTLCKNFVDYLVEVLDGRTSFSFPSPLGPRYRDLHAPLGAYAWPYSRRTVHTPGGGVHTLPARSTLAANTALLTTLQTGVRSAYAAGTSADLQDWAAAIMTWGGVYTARGNRPWLLGLGTGTYAYFRRAAGVLSQPDDTAIRTMPDLRSNAGLSKVYALLLDDFVIYDSRVAAALAWLVCDWWSRQHSLGGTALPHDLRFLCMKANSTRPKKRSPNAAVFPYVSISSPATCQRHAKWNLRANWIIEAAAVAAKGSATHPQLSMREIEAALFVLGEYLP